jgi:predicted RNA-binding Zn-ribbon protein involved in translation (DUF1610 family)
MSTNLKKFFARALRWKRFPKQEYRCPRCGCIFANTDGKLSGWQNHPYGFHVHCPNCGKTVDKELDYPRKERNSNS